MTSLWGPLTPLILGSALVPVQVMITMLFLRSSSGKVTAWAFVGGMTTVRLIQGGIFGLVLSDATTANSEEGGPGLILSVVLLILGVVFLATAAKSVATGDDPDGPPPKWLAMTEGTGPAKAYLFGVAILALAPKFWIFTLGAISAIGAANLGQPNAGLMFLLFVALAESLSLGVLVYALIAPRQSEHVLERVATWLRHHNRILMIVIGLVFGVWFSLKGLSGLGIL